MSTNFSKRFTLKTEAILAEDFFSTKISNKRRLLLLEGADDDHILSAHYFYRGESPENYEVSISEGKSRALKHQKALVDKGHVVACLLDRDYSFLLNNAVEASNIFYYPYFELENYVVSDEILKKLANYYIECHSEEVFKTLKSKIDNFVWLFSNQVKLKIFVELNYEYKVHDLSKEEMDILSGIVNTKVSSIIQNDSPSLKDKSPEQKVFLFYNQNLKKINLSLEAVDQMLEDKKIDVTSYLKEKHPDEDISFFRYLVDGKLLLHELNLILDKVTSIDELAPIKQKKKSQVQMNIALFQDWIPTSKIYKDLIDKIEKEFQT